MRFSPASIMSTVMLGSSCQSSSHDTAGCAAINDDIVVFLRSTVVHIAKSVGPMVIDAVGNDRFAVGRHSGIWLCFGADLLDLL